MNLFILLGFLCCAVVTTVIPIGPLEPKKICVQNYRGDRPNYRLPNHTKPETYDITLRTYLENDDFHFDGEVIIYVRVLEPTTKIKIHHRELTIGKVELWNGANNIYKSPFKYDKITELLTIKSKTELIKRNAYKLIITFKGELRNSNDGFFRTSYYDSNGNKR